MSPLLGRRGRTPAAKAYHRAARPSLDSPWRDASYAVVDLETTGLDPGSDEIISFSSIPIDGGRVRVGEAASGLVRPRRMPGPPTIRIHGLRESDLEGAPPLDEALEPILEALTGRYLVAHAAWVERGFLSGALKGAGVRLREPIIDTSQLALHEDGRHGAAGEGAIAPLSREARRLGLPVHRPHHASGDALTTAQLFIALATRLERTGPQTVRSLAGLSRID